MYFPPAFQRNWNRWTISSCWYRCCRWKLPPLLLNNFTQTLLYLWVSAVPVQGQALWSQIAITAWLRACVRAWEQHSSESVTRCSLSCAASAVAKSDVFSQSICFIVSWGEVGCDGSTGASFKAKHKRGHSSWPRCSPACLQAGCSCCVQLPALLYSKTCHSEHSKGFKIQSLVDQKQSGDYCCTGSVFISTGSHLHDCIIFLLHYAQFPFPIICKLHFLSYLLGWTYVTQQPHQTLGDFCRRTRQFWSALGWIN